MGGIVMGTIHGKVRYVKQQKAWAVKLKWRGKRKHFSFYYDNLGRGKTCQTEDEARMLQMIISNEIEHNTFDPRRYQRSKPKHIENAIESWLKDVKPDISYATFKAYRAAVRNIVQSLGHIFIRDLQYAHIKQWVSESKKSLNLKTVKNYHGVLAKFLRDSRKLGDISQLPEMVEFRGGLSVPTTDPEWITAEQQEAILNEIPAEDRYIFRFMMLTGVRPSEARALRWCDVYQDRGYIVIRNTFAPGRHKESLKEVKQKRDRRLTITNSLKQLFRTMPRNLHSQFVFLQSRTGTPFTKNINRDYWNPASIKALQRVVSLNNATRHSFANQLIDSGADIYSVSKRMGHSSVKVTETNYINSRAGME